MVVGTVVDAAIGWLVQTILGNLFTDKVEAWARRVGLADDVKKLKSDMRYVQMVVTAAKGRKIGNEPLAQSLVDLKGLLHDAEDVLDELDYYRLQEQVTSEVEGPPSLGGIRSLKLYDWPDLVPWLEGLLSEGYDMRPRLVGLGVDDLSILTTSWCMHFTSLRQLELFGLSEEVASLTDEQERALQLLTSLRELIFRSCEGLEELPVGLHSLPSLEKLEITDCKGISRLPEMGLPPSLEVLDISDCCEELTEQCRELATNKLMVKIDNEYVN